MSTITHLNPDTGIDHTCVILTPDANADADLRVEYDGIRWVDVALKVGPTDARPEVAEASLLLAIDLELIPDLIERLQAEMDRGLEVRAYRRYERACDDEDLEPHTLEMWNVHGRPTGPLG